MTDHDDRRADDSDPQLRALRAVWLAMPDEDPPERGLGELMAAARVKADEMARPSWWRRALDAMKRPPVLALATITVLATGVALIGQRKDELEPAPAATPALPASPAQIATPPADFGSASTSQPAESSFVPLEKHPARTFHHETGHDLSRAGGGGPAPMPAPAPSKARLVDQPPPPPQAAPAPKPSVVAKPSAPEAASGAAVDVDEVKAKTDAPKKPAIGQLLGQCRSAATRGDCAAVRALARRISQQDASYYRDNVASDATITTCLSQ